MDSTSSNTCSRLKAQTYAASILSLCYIAKADRKIAKFPTDLSELQNVTDGLL